MEALILNLLQIATLSGMILLTVMCSYLLVVTLAAYRFASTEIPPAPPLDITAVIPAHNEEKLLGRTLASLLSAKYPREKLSIVVIADNCTDKTAEIATSMGVALLGRQNL